MHKNDSVRNLNIIFFVVVGMMLIYFFIYKPYFTYDGKIDREMKNYSEAREKVLYYVCGLPESDDYRIRFKKECAEQKERAEFEEWERGGYAPM